VGIEFGDPREATRVFETLAHRLGHYGPDVLYEVVGRYGGTKGGRRASELLRQPDVAAIATPALRVVIELRDAPCDDKARLYERAVAVGDERALALLAVFRSPKCDSTKGKCCIRSDPALEQAMKQLREKL